MKFFSAGRECHLNQYLTASVVLALTCLPINMSVYLCALCVVETVLLYGL